MSEMLTGVQGVQGVVFFTSGHGRVLHDWNSCGKFKSKVQGSCFPDAFKAKLFFERSHAAAKCTKR